MDGCEIQLHGLKGAGKTTVLHFIGRALREHGFNVKATDSVGDVQRFEPLDDWPRDQREIRISTHEGV